jgi:septal ring factor EnvC (AmiA/AmiB activator)
MTDHDTSFSPDTFANALTLLSVALDAKATIERLKTLDARIAEFEAAKAGAEKAQADLAATTASSHAELARREQAAADREKEQDKRQAAIDVKYAGFEKAKADALADIDQKRRHLNSRMLAFAGLVRHPLQSEPTDEQIDRELFGTRNDVHIDADDHMATTEEMPRIGGGTLSRTTRNNRPPQPTADHRFVR